MVDARFHARRYVDLRPTLTPELVAEHEHQPFGQHSDALRRVLTYLGSFAIPGKLIVEYGGDERWYVSRFTTAPAGLRTERVAGPYPTKKLDSEVNGVYPLLDQPAQVGSYGRLPGARDILRSPDGSLTLFAFVQPTTDGARRPVLSAWDAATSTGVALVLTEGLRPAVVLGTGRDSRCLTAPAGLRAATWYALAASWDGATGLAAVTAVPVVNS
ncbi:hypothetical protein [Frankia sp. QA3]|uniref:hypothetical protein n=1 Tax=Frankia sp. QA3 TaxID=710111 RepID=UPI0002E561F8|nr:hypothetical protein [Frankia sp. QA3]